MKVSQYVESLIEFLSRRDMHGMGRAEKKGVTFDSAVVYVGYPDIKIRNPDGPAGSGYFISSSNL
jgi:hypothetical protein